MTDLADPQVYTSFIANGRAHVVRVGDIFKANGDFVVTSTAPWADLHIRIHSGGEIPSHDELHAKLAVATPPPALQRDVQRLLKRSGGRPPLTRLQRDAKKARDFEILYGVRRLQAVNRAEDRRAKKRPVGRKAPLERAIDAVAAGHDLKPSTVLDIFKRARKRHPGFLVSLGGEKLRE